MNILHIPPILAIPDNHEVSHPCSAESQWLRRQAAINSVKTGTKQKRAALVTAALFLPPEEAVKQLRCMRNDLPTPMFDYLLRGTCQPQNIPWQRVKPLGRTSGYNTPPAWFMIMTTCGKPYLRGGEVSKKYSYFHLQEDVSGHTAKYSPVFKVKKEAAIHATTRFRTGLAGLALLEEAAARNKDFARFFNAYLPPEHITSYKAEQVGAILLGSVTRGQ